MNIALFVFGAALGSFINVLALRYDPERFILNPRIMGGRSRCPHCKKTLRWFELVPIFSFIFQRGRCRKCGVGISMQYPIVEIVSGLICVLVPMRLESIFSFGNSDWIPTFAGMTLGNAIFYFLLSIIWVLIFLTLLLIVLIDLRLYIIPDEANIFLGFLGLLTIFFIESNGGAIHSSFLGAYAMLFGFPQNAWVNHILAALLGGGLFALIIGATRGRGMGVGDLKLIVPLGLIFGWPDILIVISLGFIIGAVFGVCAIVAGGKTLKSAVPFGPFLAIAAGLIFFFGYDLIQLYARLFGI